MKIVLIVGSLRARSFNLELAREVQKLLPDVQTPILDWKDVPFFSQDDENPVPAIVQNIKDEINSADGIWFFTPEYNGMIPGGLKNLLDWLSRSNIPGNFASGTCLRGKPAALAGAGGRNATKSSRAQLTTLLHTLQCRVMDEPQEGFAVPPTSMRDDSWTLSTEDIERLKAEANAFVSFIAQKTE